jgi:hypothetical protein
MLTREVPALDGASGTEQQSFARRERPVARTEPKSNKAQTASPNVLAVGSLDRGWLVALVWKLGTTRAGRESKMMARFGRVLYWCSLAIAFLCWIAALTILTAIVTNRLSDSGAWMAVWFFAVLGSVAWIVGRTAKSVLAGMT